MPPATLPPAWTANATSASAFLRGMAAAPTNAAGILLVFTGLGFGALAHDLGYTLGHLLFISVAVFALPAQVLLVDELARGAGIAAAALAVSLSAIRLLPMTVSLMPLLRRDRPSRLLHLLAVHFVNVTSWIEGNRLLPPLPTELRLPFFAGQGIGFAILISIGSALGFLLSARLPPVAAAALLMMTPIYFMSSLLHAARAAADYAAIILGGIAGPVVFYLAPGLDLLFAGVGAGTIAWLIGRRGRRP